MSRKKRNHRVYLEDILSAIMKIEKYTEANKDLFFAEEKTQDAVIYQISIIGEAAARLPVIMKSKHPEIPWRKIIGMRNIVIHDYSEADIPTIWIVVERDLPVLKKTIEVMIEEIPAD